MRQNETVLQTQFMVPPSTNVVEELEEEYNPSAELTFKPFKERDYAVLISRNFHCDENGNHCWRNYKLNINLNSFHIRSTNEKVWASFFSAEDIHIVLDQILPPEFAIKANKALDTSKLHSDLDIENVTGLTSFENFYFASESKFQPSVAKLLLDQEVA